MLGTVLTEYDIIFVANVFVFSAKVGELRLALLDSSFLWRTRGEKEEFNKYKQIDFCTHRYDKRGSFTFPWISFLSYTKSTNDGLYLHVIRNMPFVAAGCGRFRVVALPRLTTCHVDGWHLRART